MNLGDKFTFNIIPHCEDKMFSYRVSTDRIKYILLFMIIIILTLSGAFSYYYFKYHMSLKEVKKLTSIKQKNKKIAKQNKYLSKKLSDLSQTKKEIRKEFDNIKEFNSEIKNILNVDRKILASNNALEDNSFYQLTKLNQQAVMELEENMTEFKGKLIAQNKKLYSLKNRALDYKNYLASKPKGWPIKGTRGRVTSYFGNRNHPVFEEMRFHDGLDIAVWYNNKIVATGKGKVISAGDSGDGYGRKVVIDHGYGYETLYAHNNRVLVRVGERVVRGQVIALSGNSGRSTGPHLHYEINYKGKPVDPMKYQ